jgi:hypothetical protein
MAKKSIDVNRFTYFDDFFMRSSIFYPNPRKKIWKYENKEK